MGKQLVIKDANFEQHHVSKLANYTDISNEITPLSTIGNRGTLHYPSNNQPYEFLYYSGLGNMYVAGIDVTAYRGREIVVSIYAQELLPGYYTTFFVSSFNTTLPWTSTSSIKNAFVSVEDIAPKGNNMGAYNIYRLTVPENATHLIFRAKPDVPSKVYLLDEE